MGEPMRHKDGKRRRKKGVENDGNGIDANPDSHADAE